MSDLKLIGEHAAKILPTLGSTDFPLQLVSMLRDWVEIDEACLIIYPGVSAPYIAHRENQNPIDGPTLDNFVQGPFLLDPYYVGAAKKQKFGFFHLSELAPHGFNTSEYYRTYYRYSGIFDECGYLIQLGEGGFANLSLARTNGQQPFDNTCLDKLLQLEPLINAFFRQHWQAQPAHHIASPSNFHAQLEAALLGFGESVLTPREQQVINAILHGQISKAIAADLDISIETVKLHRKNAYRKLSIRNQSELIDIFIQALKSCTEEYKCGDPLQSLNPTPNTIQTRN